MLVMKLIGAYLLLINLAALAAYGADKQFAIHKKMRISERTLLLLALAGGALGALLGMYLFHHKTAKLKFAVGVPLFLITWLLLLLLLFSHQMREKTRPSGVVRLQLDQIQALDEETIRNFISYESLTGDTTAADSDHALSAILAFFKQFRYDVLSETITGEKAEVEVKITNIDTHALARDLCLEMTRQRIDTLNDQSQPEQIDYFALLSTMLSTHEYKTADTQAVFRLQKQNREWRILTDEALQDELVSGFITNINDPMLLMPEEVLTLYMEKVKSMTADEWLQYLDIQNIFSTYSPDYMDALDHLYMEKITQYFDYRIESCSIEGEKAQAEMTITSLNMPEIVKEYRIALLEYASTTESITSDSTTLANTTASLLISAIEENASPAEYPAGITLVNDGRSWQPQVDQDLTNAFLGDMEDALKVLREEEEAAEEETEDF